MTLKNLSEFFLYNVKKNAAKINQKINKCYLTMIYSSLKDNSLSVEGSFILIGSLYMNSFSAFPSSLKERRKSRFIGL